jgi:hypothetical protein
MCCKVSPMWLGRLSLVATVGYLAATLAGAVHAVELHYEPFLIGPNAPTEYIVGHADPAATLGVGGQGATGFFQPWVVNTGTGFGTLPDVQADSAVKPGQLHPSQGGSLSIGDESFVAGFGSGFAVGERAGRLFTTPWDTTTVGEFWMSALIGFGEQGGYTGYRAFEMWNAGVDSSNRALAIGYSGTFGDFNQTDGNHLGARINNDDSQPGVTTIALSNSPNIITDNGAVHCLVLHFSLNTDRNGDKVEIYIDPMGTDVSQIAPNGVFENFEFQAGSFSVAQYQFDAPLPGTLPGSEGIFDEMRVGTTYADVACCGIVPEPATFSLVGLGAMGLLFVARRKRA